MGLRAPGTFDSVSTVRSGFGFTCWNFFRPITNATAPTMPQRTATTSAAQPAGMALSIALMWALASAIPTGWAALIVAVLWGVIAAVAGLMGKKKFDQVNPKPERTVETLSQVPGALKPN